MRLVASVDDSCKNKITVYPLRKTLKYSIIDGSFYSLAVGFGEAYFAAFAIAAGTTDTFAGLLTVVPLLLGSMAQIFVPLAVKHFRSYRKWVCIMALLQSFSLLALAQIATLSQASGFLIFLAITFYWLTSMATNPAWNSWMGSFVPSAIRIRFFAHRNRTLQLFSLIGILGAGYFLQQTKERPDHLAFAILFSLAGFCRLVSTCYLFRSHEPLEIAHNIQPLSLVTQFRHLRNSPPGKLFLYLLAIHFTTNIASPFFGPYMLSELKMSYHEFALLTAAAMTAKFISLPVWGRRAARRSVTKLLSTGMLGIFLIPWFWLVSHNFYYLMVLQIFGGVFWAAQELGTFLIFFEHFEPRTRTSFLSLFSLLNNTGVVLGSLLGGLTLRLLGENSTGYAMVFVLSGLLRLVPLMAMPTCLNLPRKKKLPNIINTRLFPLFNAMMRTHFLQNRRRRKYVSNAATDQEHCDHRPRRPWQNNAS